MEVYPKTELSLMDAEVNGLQLYHGFNDSLRRQLVWKSRQQHILRATYNDAAERFTTLVSLEKWLSKGRDVYTLVDDRELAGITWYGPKEIPVATESPNPPGHTFAIRLYQRYEAKGHAKKMMDAGLRNYRHLLESRGETDGFNGLWLATKPDNVKARGLFTSYGYEEVDVTDKKVIMILYPDMIAKRLGA